MPTTWIMNAVRFTGVAMQLLSNLSLFVEVAKRQNFARAAAALEIPRSTLSRRVSELEKELGVPLITRTTRSFLLTEAGEACYERARKLVADATKIKEEVGVGASTISGRLRIGVPMDLAATLFVPMFTAFMGAHPDVSLDVVALNVNVNLMTEGLDFAIQVAHQIRLPDSSYHSRRIGSFKRKLFASKLYLRTRGALQEPSDLEHHDCIRFSLGTTQKTWVLQSGRNKKEVAVGGTFSANSVGLIAQAARGGLGVALLPDFLAIHPGFGDGLVQILSGWEGTEANVFALSPTSYQSTKVRCCIDFLKEAFVGTQGKL